MRGYDFWITLSVMTIILLIVIVIKCIPKHKLPYCLGGTREQESFVCVKDYIKWCKTNGIPQVVKSDELAKKDKSWVLNETCNRLKIDKSLLTPF
jgi:hypothetical protein